MNISNINNFPNTPINNIQKKTHLMAEEKQPQENFSKNIAPDALIDNLKNFAKEKGTAFLKQPMFTTQPKVSEERKQAIMDTLQPGDLILSKNHLYPGWQIMEQTLGESDYAHVAIYEGDGKFLESSASGGGVIRSEMSKDLDSHRSYQIIRPPYKSEESVNRALDYTRSQLGKPYDSEFDAVDDSKHYCAELVLGAMKAADESFDVPPTYVLGRNAYFPNSFQKLEGAEIVYDDKIGFKESMYMHDLRKMGDLLSHPEIASALSMGGVTGSLTALAIGGNIQAAALHK